MPKCRLYRSQIADVFRGGLDPAIGSSLERHLADCPACLALFRETKETIMLTERRFKPDPGQEFWDGYWDRLQARMAAETEAVKTLPGSDIRPVRRRLSFLRLLAIPSAAAALLVAGILIGRFGTRSTPAPRENVSALKASDLDIRANQYLDRSKRILLALVNYGPETGDSFGLDLPGQKKASRSLVQSAAVLRSDLSKAKERRLENLVGALQTILMQIANLESENDLDAVRIVRAGMEGRDILFQINMAEMRGPAGGRGGMTPPSTSGRVRNRNL